MMGECVFALFSAADTSPVCRFGRVLRERCRKCKQIRCTIVSPPTLPLLTPTPAPSPVPSARDFRGLLFFAHRLNPPSPVVLTPAAFSSSPPPLLHWLARTLHPSALLLPVAFSPPLCRALHNNQLSALPVGAFDKLTALTDL